MGRRASTGRDQQGEVGRPTAAACAVRLSRRWPWVLGAALIGAVVGKAVAAAARRLEGEDAPGAVEPSELRAVVDRLRPDPTGRPAPSAAGPEPA